MTSSISQSSVSTWLHRNSNSHSVVDSLQVFLLSVAMNGEGNFLRNDSVCEWRAINFIKSSLNVLFPKTSFHSIPYNMFLLPLASFTTASLEHQASLIFTTQIYRDKHNWLSLQLKASTESRKYFLNRIIISSLNGVSFTLAICRLFGLKFSFYWSCLTLFYCVIPWCLTILKYCLAGKACLEIWGG